MWNRSSCHRKPKLAREFVSAAIHEKPAADIRHQFHQEFTPGCRPVLRITFVGQNVVQPLITQASRLHNVDFNILQADIETVHGKTMGFLMVDVVGDEHSGRDAQAFLQKHNLQVEVVGYVG